jgi:hypothetical protein
VNERLGKAPISVEPGFIEDDDRPVIGKRRVVRYLPVGLPGKKGLLRPCIWMSPYEVDDPNLGEKAKLCVLLVEKRPRPMIVGVRIAARSISEFPTGVIECAENDDADPLFLSAGTDPIRGRTRLVKHIPLPGNIARPCIWATPFDTYDEDLKEKVVICCLLMDEGPPEPNVVSVRVPSAALHKFPSAPITW